MSRKMGRPEVRDETKLKKVARILAKGEAASRHDAQVRVVTEEMPDANSLQVDSAVRRLERKWKKRGDAIIEMVEQDIAQEQILRRSPRTADRSNLPSSAIAATFQNQVTRIIDRQGALDRMVRSSQSATESLRRLREQTMVIENVTKNLSSFSALDQLRQMRDRHQTLQDMVYRTTSLPWPRR